MMPTKTCTFDGCDKPYYGRGLCDGHYKQNRKGQELRPLRPSSRGLTLEQRFWAKVRKTDECWVWTASVNGDGYGQIKVDGRLRKAHRLAWEMTNGPIPKGMHIDHRCANPLCVNPAHLRIVTNAQNLQHRTGAQANSKSGVRGVTWHKRANAWRAHARLNGRQYYGGLHPTIEAADQAARALRAELFTHDDHSDWLKEQEKTS